MGYEVLDTTCCSVVQRQITHTHTHGYVTVVTTSWKHNSLKVLNEMVQDNKQSETVWYSGEVSERYSVVSYSIV